MRAPTTELGYPDSYLAYSSSSDPLLGMKLGWHDFMDMHEHVPDLVWPMNITVYDQMRTDSQIAALWTALSYGIRGLRYVLDANGARPELVNEISEDLNIPIMGRDNQPRRRMKRRFTHKKHVAQSLLSTMYGHMYFEQYGDIVDGKWRLRKLAPRMPHTIQSINVADDGGLIYIKQWPRSGVGTAPTETKPIPVDRLVGMIFEQEGASWTGRSLFRDCWKNWVIKDRLIRVDAVNHERAGGIPYAEGSPGMSGPELEELNLLMQQFRVGDFSGMALPSGAKLNIAKGTGSDVVSSWRAHDEAMARRFLLMLMNLAQGGQHVGSYGMAESFQDTWFIGQRAIAEWYCDVMTEHVIEDIADWNYGEDEELTPILTWERTSEDSLGDDILTQFVRDGVIVMDDETEDWVRYRHRMPKRTSPRPEPAAPTTPAEAGDGGTPAAPSGQKPSPATASFEAAEPHVMASGEPVLVTVANVPILEAGIEYPLSTGSTTFTPEDLRDAVTAANEDSAVPSPRLKIGHIDPRYNSSKPYDGTPSFGKATNLRLGDNGMTVYADYVGVPKWLAGVLPVAYPNRSIEGFWNVSTQTGKKWRFILSAVALLGVQWPGVTNLEDLPLYYGEEMPADVEVVTAATGGDQEVKWPGKKKSAAAANLDDIRRAFYNDYVAATPEANMWWVRAVMTDPNQLVVEDDKDGQLYLIPFSSDGDGEVSFGEASPVRVDYVPDQSKKAAATHVAATLAVGREVMATYATRAESDPDGPETTGGAMDPKEVRERLGLPEDASDEQVQEALTELATGVGLTAPAKPGTSTVQPQGGVTPIGTGGTEQPADPDKEYQGYTPEGQPPPAGASDASFKPPAGMVLIDEGTLATIRAGAAAGMAVKSDLDKRSRETLVEAAVNDGRIPPSRKDWWVTALETDFEGYSQSLASMPTGMIPVSREAGSGMIGHGGTAEDVLASQDIVQNWTDSLFPDVAHRRRLEQQVQASGAGAYPRIMSDVDPRLNSGGYVAQLPEVK